MSSLSKSFRLSSTLKIEEEAMILNKNQGISSILGSDTYDERSSKSSSSLRRTLSADMSSTKWLTQHGVFSPMKKIASSEKFTISSSTYSSSSESEKENDDTDTEPQSQYDIWSSIQEEVCKKKQLDEKSGQLDIWSSIIQQKSQDITDNKPPPPPYIHPLVKRSSSSLSEKGLEICTESLGSETGSDGFSSYPASESGDTEDDKEKEQEQLERELEQTSFDNFEQMFIPKYNHVTDLRKSSAQRSFPPPIPSRHDGAYIRLQSRRDNGRLVLEAFSVPCTNNFLAQRQDGRLVLTFANTIFSTEMEHQVKKEVEELEEEFDTFDDEDIQSSDDAEEETTDEEEEEEEEAAFVMEQAPKLSSRVINVKLMGFANKDPTWLNKFNEVAKFDEVEEDIKPTIVAKSLPPMAQMLPKPPAAGTVTAATSCSGGGVSFNAYDYYWRPKPMTTESKGNKLNKSLENNKEQQQLLVSRGNKGDNYVVKSCKEPRRSLLFWESYCIATS